jgi:VWFA-related protein
MRQPFIFALVLSTAIGGWLRSRVRPTVGWQTGNESRRNSEQATPHTADSSASSERDSPEITSQDASTTFRVDVKLVLARVAVRDRQGHAIKNLPREDFQIFDNGKAQTITEFSVERQREKAEATAESPSPNPGIAPEILKPIPSAPERYIAYLFDDIHLNSGDLARARAGAERILAVSVPTNRFAIFSTSGETTLNFTDDTAKLSATFAALRPQPMHSEEALKCPDLSLYTADLITNKHDPEAREAAINEVISPPRCYTGSNPRRFVEEAAARVFAMGEQDNRAVIGAIKNTVRRLTVMPGDRTIVLVSPGFVIPTLEYDNDEVISEALRAQVVINALDARGLYVVPALGADKGFGAGVNRDRPGQLASSSTSTQLARQAADRQKDVLAALANNTGGKFFFDSNDIDEGFQRLTGGSEYAYVLGFIPQDLKADGKYHKLKIKLQTKQKVKLHAREGYFAPKSFVDSAQQARQELEQAMFSRNELHGLPVKFETRSEIAQDTRKLSVLVHVDVKLLHFTKSEGRNCNVLTVASLIFDRNGNYLQGTEKTISLRLKDETLEHNSEGLTLKTVFEMKPGSYTVRVVTRDDRDHLMSATNAIVELAATPASPVASLPVSLPKEHLPDESRPKPSSNMPSNRDEVESSLAAEATPYLEGPVSKLRAKVPELKGLDPATSQEQLAYILQRAGEECVRLLSRIPNIISREEVISLVPTPPRIVSLEPYIGIQREKFDYLLLSRQTADGIRLQEYRMVNGRPVTGPFALGQLSQGFTSEWLRLYPANRCESRFRYLGQQRMDKHETFVVGFAQIPESVKFPAHFQLPEKEVAISLQGVVWIDTLDFRIVRMREDLLAPRPDIGLKKFTTTIRFDEVNIARAASSLWLPKEVVVDWYFQGQNVQRRHRYSDYRLYRAKARILPASPESLSH